MNTNKRVLSLEAKVWQLREIVKKQQPKCDEEAIDSTRCNTPTAETVGNKIADFDNLAVTSMCKNLWENDVPSPNVQKSEAELQMGEKTAEDPDPESIAQHSKVEKNVLDEKIDTPAAIAKQLYLLQFEVTSVITNFVKTRNTFHACR